MTLKRKINYRNKIIGTLLLASFLLSRQIFLLCPCLYREENSVETQTLKEDVYFAKQDEIRIFTRGEVRMA